MRRCAWLFGSIAFLTPALASAATYVVAPDGDDASSGLAGSPWATLQHAADTVKAGDTVTVEPGMYAGFYLTTSGTANAPITFSARDGVLITSENAQTNLDGINIEDTNDGQVISYVIVEGFTINDMARTGIRTAVSSHVTIRRNKLDHNGKWGILTGFAEDVVIEDNECSRSIDEHGIYVGNSADGPIIRRNKCWGNNANGIHMNGDAEQGGDGIIDNALVEANILWDNGVAGGSGINCDGVSGSRIHNNLIFDTHGSGISLYQVDGGEPSQNNVVVNNTVLVAANGRWALNIREGAVGNRVHNNILWNAHSFRGAVNIAPDALPGFVADNNLMLDRFTLDDGDTVIGLAAWQAATGQDTASSVAEPQFVSPDTDNYHALPNSPSVDKGTSTDAPETDLDGVARPFNGEFDIGAYEYCEFSCVPGTGAGGSGGGNGGGPIGGAGGTGGASGGAGGAGANGATTTGGSGGGGDISDGGCGCRTAGSDAGSNGALVLLGAALATGLSRRRRR